MQDSQAAPGALYQGLLYLSSKHAGISCNLSAVVIHLHSSDTQHEALTGRAPTLARPHEVSIVSY